MPVELRKAGTHKSGLVRVLLKGQIRKTRAPFGFKLKIMTPIYPCCVTISETPATTVYDSSTLATKAALKAC